MIEPEKNLAMKHLTNAKRTHTTKNSREFTGNFCIDDNLLAENGVEDFSQYAEVPFEQLAPDFFVPDYIEVPESSRNS